MLPNLARYFNKTIWVSIPALFQDGVCGPYRLLGAELNGLWLQSDELTARLLPPGSDDLTHSAPVVFVPFAQIAGVLVATAVPAQPGPGTTDGALPEHKRAPRPAPAPRRTTSTTASRKGRRKEY